MKLFADKDALLSGDTAQAFCPDNALDIGSPDFPAYIHAFEEAAGFSFACIKCIKRALTQRIGYFAENGCKAAVHNPGDVTYTEATDMELTPIFKKGVAGEALTEAEISAYKTGLLLHCARQYAKHGIAMEASFADENLAKAVAAAQQGA